jgi:hypothetical protein
MFPKNLQAGGNYKYSDLLKKSKTFKKKKKKSKTFKKKKKKSKTLKKKKYSYKKGMLMKRDGVLMKYHGKKWVKV